jgi:NAD(P)-dependent dehydrogenase (short-subunit alcohol dehydrogenase family)
VSPIDGALTGRNAVVTGASRGIGEAILQAFLDSGAAKVVAIARSADRLEAAAAADDRVVPIVADLADHTEVTAAFDTAIEKVGRLDVLVNNAGMGWTRRSTRLDAEQFDHLYAVNLRACTLLAVKAAAHMADHVGGSIINVSSVTAISGAPYLSAYAATKGALDALTRSLAAEWGPAGVRVNSLSPGVIDTDIWADSGNDARLRRFVEDQISLGRWGTTKDIAGPAVFLASDASAYMTGQTMVVDGGMTSRIDLVLR